jgi:hypothetical protein
MLDRVEMDVIDVPLEIAVVANCMFPEPALPQCRFAIFMA